MGVLSNKKQAWEHDDPQADTEIRPSIQARNFDRTLNQRKEEGQCVQFRTDRIFSIGHEWFFATREGVNFGPYRKKEHAQSALKTFLFMVS